MTGRANTLRNIALGLEPDAARELMEVAGELKRLTPTSTEQEQHERRAAEEAAVSAGQPYPCFSSAPVPQRDCESDGYYLCEGCTILKPDSAVARGFLPSESQP